MTATDFIYNHTYKTVLELGYSSIEADDVAQVIVGRWRRNEIKKSSRFLDEAKKYARSQYSTMNKKRD